MKARYIYHIVILLAVTDASKSLSISGSSLKGAKSAVCYDIRQSIEDRGTSKKYQWDRYIPRYTVTERCCEGYANKSGTCEPQCSSSCENGYCSSPNKCSCNKGYEETQQDTCIPICDKICINGKCTGPDKCSCDEGYELKNDGFTCEPVCSSSCENGWCSEPNTCACHPGFKRTDDNQCEPICSGGCENGKCIGPEICACDHGYETPPGNNSVCVPRCKRTCAFGSCSAPDKCTCNEGYRPGKHHHICEPKCDRPCSNGWCSAPNTCGCNTGYEKDTETGECVPVCDKPCDKNSACVAPNTCACFIGYEKSQDQKNASVCGPRCTRPCSFGKCTAPETCSCDIGYRLSGEDEFTCEPICDKGCERGYCSKPNVCECDRGYKKNATDECEPVCKVECTNGKCVGPDRCQCNVGFRLYNDNFYCEPVFSKGCEPGASCTAPETCTCREDYVRDQAGNGSCVTTCEPSCKRGYCVAKKCVCYFGWEGDSCDQPVFCVVTSLLDANSTKPQNKLAESYQADVTDGNRRVNWTWPTCLTKCLDQLNSTVKNYTIKTRVTTQYLIPIDSPCNAEASRKSQGMSGGAIGAVIGISLLVAAAIIGGVIFKRSMRTRGGMTGVFSTDSVDGTERLVSDCVEVDAISST